MTEQIFIRQFSQMPDGIKQEVLAFFEYLTFKHKLLQGMPKVLVDTDPKSFADETQKKTLKAGFLKGTFFLADDFNAPLEDFKDYM
jgi:hypothetical protein